MPNIHTVSHTEYCPYINETHTIYINYIEVVTTGSQKNQSKRGRYDCEYYEECPEPDKHKYGFCPVYETAPITKTF